jgi:hypothetical protein
MSRSLIQLFIDLQIWMMNHINQIYFWMCAASAIVGGLHYYTQSHPMSLITYIISAIFIYYASAVIIIRD